MREMTEWLVRVLAWCAPDLAADLVVEILGQHGFWVRIRYTSSGCHQLLKLNASNEIFILRRHQAIPSRQKEDLVVSLRPLGIFHQVGITLLGGEVRELGWVGDDRHSIARDPVWRYLLELRRLLLGALGLERSTLARARTRGRHALRRRVHVLCHVQGSTRWHMARPAIELRHSGWRHLRQMTLSQLCLQELRVNRRIPIWECLKVLVLRVVLGLDHGSKERISCWCHCVTALTHLRFHLLQTHHLPVRGSGIGFLLRDSPNTGLCLEVWNISGVGVLLIT